MANYSAEKYFLENPRDYNAAIIISLTLQLHFFLWSSSLIDWEEYRSGDSFLIPIHIKRETGKYSISLGDTPTGGEIMSDFAYRYLNLEGCSKLVFSLLEQFSQS